MSTTVLSVLDTQSISLSFFVDEEDWQGKFTHLEVWRSQAGESGPYERLLGPNWDPARLPVDAGEESGATGGSVNIVGKALEFVLNDVLSFSHTFTGSDPLTKAQCASQLNVAFANYVYAYIDANGVFVLETVQGGLLASLRVAAGDAAALLGLPVDETAYGTDVRIPMQPTILKYNFRDPYGKTSYHYKARLYNAYTNEVGAFTAPITGASRTAIDPSQLAVGYVKIMGLDGRAVKDKEVLLYNSYKAAQVTDFTIVNEGQKKLTDANGYAEFVLVRGTSVDVVLPGTSLVQRVLVPTDTTVTKFNLLDPAYGNNDAFGVQRVDFAYAERRTL